MSGETEEMTTDGISVNDDLVWADNPELEYFRSMMNERMDERVASGLDMNDSLIGDSTLHDMMDGELQMMESFDSNSLSQYEQQQPQSSRRKSPRKASVLDSSGLSLAEDDTIDNIITEDGSILAWFSRQRKERARKAREEGTLNSDPITLDAQELDPATGVQQSRQPPVQNQQQQRRRLFHTPDRSRPPSLPPKQQYEHETNIEQDDSVEHSKLCIPGFIFVNSGQSLSVQTRSGSTSKTHKEGSGSSGKRRKRRLSTKTIILLLVLAVVIAGIMLAVVFTNNRTSRRSQSNSSSAQGSDPAASVPSAAPTIALVETTSEPDPTDTIAPGTSAPSGDEVTTLDPLLPSPTVAPSTIRPTLPTVRSRLGALAPISSEAWLNPDSPQSLAVSWLVGNEEAENYNDQQLLQRYVLASLYYSTNGENWSQSSISWNVEWTEECTWWGIECNSNGKVRILSLVEDNLSGVLPPEISLLSESLEEVYLNANNIGGTIPTEVGLLSNLRRLQLTGNSLTGVLPSVLGNLSSMRLISFKSNQIGGTLPPELGSLSLLRNLDVSRNSMTGSIPESYGNLASLGSLYLSENDFTGSVPSSFNQLSRMTIFTAERNSLTGVMPGGICGIDRLSADCVPNADEVFCEPGCCTSCCIDGGGCRAITSPPTDEPTESTTDGAVSTATPETEAPTIAGTDSPQTEPPDVIETDAPTASSTDSDTDLATEDSDFSTISPTTLPGSGSFCQVSVSTDRSCYEDGDDIVVSFQNCDSTELDWIGIYPIFADVSQLGEPLAWVWACGDQFCNEAADSGRAIFYNARGNGTFIVYLLRSSARINGLFEAYGIGNAFEMSTIC